MSATNDRDSDEGPKCPTLDGVAKYAIWKIRVKGKLSRAKCLGHALGTETRPTAPTTTTPVIYGSGYELPESWDSRDSRARAILIEYVSDRLALHLDDAKFPTAHSVWTELTRIHELENAGARAFYVFLELLGARWDGQTSVETHIGALRSASQRLTQMKRPVDDEFLAFLLLHSLPQDDLYWDTFRTTLVNSIPATEKLTFEKVEARLTATVTQRNGSSTLSPSDSALKATSPTSPTPSWPRSGSSRPTSSRPGSSGPTKTCAVHGKCKHSTDECSVVQDAVKSTKSASKGGKSKGKAKANSATDGADSSSEDDSDGAHYVSVARKLAKRVHAYVASDDLSDKRHHIIADTGASAHIMPYREWFDPATYRTLDQPHPVRFGDNSSVDAIGVGDVRLISRVSGKVFDITLSDVLHVPTFKISLVSVNRLCRKDIRSVFLSGACEFWKDNEKIMTGHHRRKLYHLDARPVAHIEPEMANATIDINVLHRRMGHHNVESLKRMVSKGRLANVEAVTGEPRFCEPCASAKIRKVHLPPKGHVNATRPLQIVHSDVGGPVNVRSHRGFSYWITFIDEHTRHPWVYFLRKKSDAEATYDQWRSDVEAYFGAEIGEMQFSSNWLEFFMTDGGGEYTSKVFEAKLKRHGVMHTMTAPDTPEQNGLAERMNQTLENSTVAALIDSGLPKSFWCYAMDYAAWTIARSPAAGLKGRVPHQMLFKRHVDPTFFRPFGCTAYALIPKDKRGGKLNRKGRKCVMLGYEYGKKSYRLFDVQTRKVINARHVVFNEKGDDDNPLRDEADPSDEQWEALLATLLRHRGVNADAEGDADPSPTKTPDEALPLGGHVGPGTRSGSVGGQAGRRDHAPRRPRDDSDDDDSPPSSPTSRDGRGRDTSPDVKVEPRSAAGAKTRVGASAPSTPSRIPRRSAQTGTSASGQSNPPAHAADGAPAPAPNAPAPSTPPSRPAASAAPGAPSRPRGAPARVVAGRRVQPSRTAAREPYDRNAEYQRALNEQAVRDAERTARRAAARQSNEAGPSTSAEGGNPAPAPPPADAEGDASAEFFDSADFAGMANGAQAPRAYPLPRNIREALSGPEAAGWQEALDAELHSLAENDVYDEVPIPEGVKPITSKPVFKVKIDQNGNVERLKLRIVARGFVQKQGVDYQDTFAPVANLESVRIIHALAAKYDLELDQMDVSTAYLNGELLEELYLLPPDGVQCKPGHCWKLKRSLYGLKQAGRTWNATLDKSLLELGFTRLDAETCLYIYREAGKGGGICFLVVYVDDLLLAASSRALMNTIKSMLSSRFKMRDLGPAKFMLGIEVERDRRARTITLSQRQYFDKVLERCGMSECKPLWTPMSQSSRITADDPEDNTTIHEVVWNGQRVSYPTVVGSLMYAMLGTRPDLAYVVGILGRYAAAPKACHWRIAKHALRYLRGTRDLALRFDGSDIAGAMDFRGYSDADWSGDADTSRSTSGYVFISNRAAIGWSSKRQAMVALSTTESEYIGLSNAGQHLLWLRAFFEDLGYGQSGPTELNCDNQAAIILTRDPQFRSRTKHIARKFHFVRDDVVGGGHAVVRYVPTDDQVADIFTKPLGREKHWRFTSAMGLVFPDS
jgi:hypothetical protein